MESNNTIFGQEKFTENEINTISSILSESLPEEEASFRQGPGGTTLTYLESWKAINLANKIFKFNGWSSSIKELSPDFIEEVPQLTGGVRYKVGVTAIVRVTLKDGTFQEDVGYGCCENPSKGTAIENAKKEAVSDARKRTLRLFGDGLGNSLYDKEANKQIANNLKNAKKNTAKPQAQQQKQPASNPTTTNNNTNNNNNNNNSSNNTNNNNNANKQQTINAPAKVTIAPAKPAPFKSTPFNISKPPAQPVQPQQQPQQQQPQQPQMVIGEIDFDFASD